MAAYISSLRRYTVLIGVTTDDAFASLTQNATSALLAIGVNVKGLAFRGKVFFATQIGQPENTVSLVATPGGANLIAAVNITGIHFFAPHTHIFLCVCLLCQFSS